MEIKECVDPKCKYKYLAQEAKELILTQDKLIKIEAISIKRSIALIKELDLVIKTVREELGDNFPKEAEKKMKNILESVGSDDLQNLPSFEIPKDL